MAEEETEDKVKKEASINCFVFFCMPLYTCLYGVIIVAVNSWGICKAMHEADHNNSSVNEWNHSAQTNQQGGLAPRTFKYVYIQPEW
jgi:hypothetical protein